ncbi:MAG: hypothetical protein JO179_01090 [Solirubrobacterales bacterium]|nr:hypothetical protein [Solirubrobacterales bacterium]
MAHATASYSDPGCEPALPVLRIGLRLVWAALTAGAIVFLWRRWRSASGPLRGSWLVERDLHDGLQQDLIAAQLKLALAADAVPENPPHGQQMIARSPGSSTRSPSRWRFAARHLSGRAPRPGTRRSGEVGGAPLCSRRHHPRLRRPPVRAGRGGSPSTSAVWRDSRTSPSTPERKPKPRSASGLTATKFSSSRSPTTALALIPAQSEPETGSRTCATGSRLSGERSRSAQARARGRSSAVAFPPTRSSRLRDATAVYQNCAKSTDASRDLQTNPRHGPALQCSLRSSPDTSNIASSGFARVAAAATSNPFPSGR